MSAVLLSAALALPALAGETAQVGEVRLLVPEGLVRAPRDAEEFLVSRASTYLQGTPYDVELGPGVETRVFCDGAQGVPDVALLVLRIPVKQPLASVASLDLAEIRTGVLAASEGKIPADRFEALRVHVGPTQVPALELRSTVTGAGYGPRTCRSLLVPRRDYLALITLDLSAGVLTSALSWETLLAGVEIRGPSPGSRPFPTIPVVLGLGGFGLILLLVRAWRRTPVVHHRWNDAAAHARSVGTSGLRAVRAVDGLPTFRPESEDVEEAREAEGAAPSDPQGREEAEPVPPPVASLPAPGRGAPAKVGPGPVRSPARPLPAPAPASEGAAPPRSAPPPRVATAVPAAAAVPPAAPPLEHRPRPLPPKAPPKPARAAGGLQVFDLSEFDGAAPAAPAVRMPVPPPAAAEAVPAPPVAAPNPAPSRLRITRNSDFFTS